MGRLARCRAPAGRPAPSRRRAGPLSKVARRVMSLSVSNRGGDPMGSVVKKRRKRMAKKKHRKLLKKTRIARRNKK